MQKLDERITRLNLVVPVALRDRIENWCRKQQELTTVSEAVRTLLEIGLENASKGGKGGKGGRHRASSSQHPPEGR